MKQSMDETLKVLVAFGSRADAGLLLPVVSGLQQDQHFECNILAIDGDGKVSEMLTKANLSPDVVLKFEFAPHVRDAKVDVAHAMGQITSQSSSALFELAPDLLIVLGDRYEIFALVSAATALTIPIAHLCGGDVTKAANDDAYRHAISKMSHLHFPSNQDAANRLISMGEKPSNVSVIGNPSLDAMCCSVPMDRSAFFDKVGLEPKEKNILATFHPETLSSVSSINQLKPMLEVFTQLGNKVGVIITAANLDAGGREINKQIIEYSEQWESVKFYPNLGSNLYHSALVHCDVVVGNSSSGLYEAPSFNCATVNIGHRQDGRLKARSVIDCRNEVSEILDAINHAFRLDCVNVKNPYGDGHAVDRLIPILKSIKNPKELLQKGFFEGEQE